MGTALAPRNSLIPGDLQPDWKAPFGSGASATRDAVPWVLAGLCLTALGVALWATRSISPLNSDTPSYLYFDPSRTVGYPAFLWLVKLATGHAAAAVPAQMVILTIALFLLGWSFHSLLGRPKLSLAFQIFLLTSPDLWKFSAELMTEALATASVALWCAQLLRLMKRPSQSGYLLLTLLSAMGMLIRPSLVILFAGSAVAVLLLEHWRERGRGILSLIGIGVIANLLTPLALLLVHGSPLTTSPLARGVLQHTLFCDAPASPADPDALFVDRDSAPVRNYLNGAPAEVSLALQHLYSAPLRFYSIIPGLGRMHNASAGWQTDPIVARIARERIAANPGCYARSVIRNFWQLETQASLHVGSAGAKVDRFLASHPPVQIASEPLLPADARELQRAATELHVAVPPSRISIGRFAARSSPLFLLLGRLLYGGAALAGLAGMLLAVARPKWTGGGAHAIALAAMGIVFHALFFCTAIVELAIIRYTVPAWPIVCTMVAAALVCLRDWMAESPQRLGRQWARTYVREA